MRAFYHPDQSAHDPRQYMRFGQIVAPKDLPARTTALLQALARHSITPRLSVAHGTAPVLDIHTPGFIRFLETAWERWCDLDAPL